MKLFLRIFKIMLLGYAFILGLAVAFTAGGLFAGSFEIPDQPDYRNVLDKITQDMNIQKLQHLLEEHFNCSMETNPGNEAFSHGLWVAPCQDMRVWHNCLIARADGDLWAHEYMFYFGSNEKLLGIDERCPRWQPDPSFLPEPWKWEPRFAMPDDRSSPRIDKTTATIGN